MIFHLVLKKMMQNPILMINKLYVTGLILLFSFGYALNIEAQDIPEPKDPPQLVNDYTNTLSQEQWRTLEEKARIFNNTTSTQIAVVIVPSLGGADASSYAFELGEKWGVGQEGFDNGIVMLVKPKTSDSRGQAFIATGYGVEHVVPDAVANQIVDNEMIPHFRQEDYYGGLNAAMTILSDLTRGEYTAAEYQQQHGSSSDGSPWIFIIIVLFFIIISIVGRAQRARHYSLGHDIPFWLALTMMSSSGHRHSGGGGGFSSFSSGSGSFGGGFGGFGGGSFGGGGAGGSW